MAKRKKRERPQAKIIEVLLPKLDDILDSFGWSGVSSRTGSDDTDNEEDSRVVVTPKVDLIESEDGSGEIEQDETEPNDLDLDDLDLEEERYVDPSDIDFAVDDAVSGVARDLTQFEEVSSLSELFAAIFGPDHPYVERTEYVEDLISPYIDLASRSDLQEAYDVLEQIVDELRRTYGI